MKQIIIYNTSTGEILRTISRSYSESEVVSGSGSVSGDEITGSGFSSASVGDLVLLTTSIRTLRLSVKEILSDTKIKVERRVLSRENGDVSYVIKSRGTPSQFSSAEMVSRIQEVRDETGLSEVDVLRIDADVAILAGAHEVDLSGPSIRRKEDAIVYE